MLQGYFATILYLAFGAGVLLVDYYGGRLLLLIRVRNSLRTSLRTQLSLILGGLALVCLKIFVPVSPGPVLLGDLIPAATCTVLLVYYIYLMYEFKKKGKTVAQEENRRFEQEIFQRTGKLIETNKRNFGFAVLACAALHFLVLQTVLI